MSVPIFETTYQKTYEWLHDLMDLLGWRDQHRAYLALKGTLHALRDRLPVEVSAKLSSQLPMLVRGFYFEGWRPAATPLRVKTPDEFLDLVSAYFNNVALNQEDDIEDIVRAVFQVVANHVSAGEVAHIQQSLPFSIAEFWPPIEYLEGQEFLRRSAKLSTRRLGF